MRLYSITGLTLLCVNLCIGYLYAFLNNKFDEVDNFFLVISFFGAFSVCPVSLDLLIFASSRACLNAYTVMPGIYDPSSSSVMIGAIIDSACMLSLSVGAEVHTSTTIDHRKIVKTSNMIITAFAKYRRARIRCQQDA